MIFSYLNVAGNFTIFRKYCVSAYAETTFTESLSSFANYFSLMEVRYFLKRLAKVTEHSIALCSSTGAVRASSVIGHKMTIRFSVEMDAFNRLNL